MRSFLLALVLLAGIANVAIGLIYLVVPNNSNMPPAVNIALGCLMVMDYVRTVNKNNNKMLIELSNLVDNKLNELNKKHVKD
jgi:hypothetical protein